MSICFFVSGIPKAAGSKRGIPIYAGKKGTPDRHWTGKTAVIDTSGQAGKDWRADVKSEARKHKPEELLTDQIHIRMDFCFPRLKGHYGTGKNADTLKESAPYWHTTKPDVLKLGRAVEDALTGIIWRDDAQICKEQLTKKYGDTPGVQIYISTM